MPGEDFHLWTKYGNWEGESSYMAKIESFAKLADTAEARTQAKCRHIRLIHISICLLRQLFNWDSHFIITFHVFYAFIQYFYFFHYVMRASGFDFVHRFQLKCPRNQTRCFAIEKNPRAFQLKISLARNKITSEDSSSMFTEAPQSIFSKKGSNWASRLNAK